MGTITYDHATNYMRFSTAGNQERMRIDSNGNVVVGATAAQAADAATLMADGEVTAAGFYFSNNIGSAMNNTGIRKATTNTMVFDTDTTERMRIESDGNVRIASQHLRFDTSGKGIIFGTFGGNNRPGIFGNYTSPTDNNITFTVTGNERMRLAADGKIGIGVTDPDQKLEVDGIIKGSSYFQGGASATSGNNFHFGAEGDGTFRIYEGNYGAGTERFRINTNGRVGIGATDPSTAQLVVYRATTNGANPIFQARSNHDTTNSVKFEVDGDGDAYFSDLVGIGTTSPAGYNTNANDIVVNKSANAGITISTPNNAVGRIAFGDQDDNNIGQIRYAHSENNMLFDVNANERMRIDSGGRIMFNMTSPLDTVAGSLNISGGTSGGRIAMQGNTTSAGAGIAEWFAHWTTNKVAGFIARSGTDTTNKDDGELGFFTRGSSGTLGERLTIDPDGDIGIGETNPQAKLHIADAADDAFEGLRIINEKNNASAPDSAILRLGVTNVGGEKVCSIRAVQESDAGNAVALTFSSNNSGGNNSETERMRIADDGTIFLSTNTNLSGGGSAGCYINNSQMQFFRGNQGDYIHFKTSSGTGIGRITNISDTSTNYNTSSDYRLKENETAISDGITRLKTLKPYRFNWKSDSSRTVDGFFAHEVTAVPEAISGTKDEVDSDNNPVYQGIDHSKLVPLLTAALQEAISKIETLEAKVAALEAA